MSISPPRRLFVVWAALVAATLASWLLGVGHGDGATAADLAVIAILGIAFTKTLVVGREFMEIRGAAPRLRILFHSWVAIVGVGLIAVYLLV